MAMKQWQQKGGQKGGKILPNKGNGKGIGHPIQPQFKPQPQHLEALFQEQANDLYEKLMDGEITTQSLAKPWNQLMDLRNQLLKAFTGGAAKQPAFQPAAMPNVDAEGTNFKVMLNQLFQKLTKTPVTKDSMRFDVQEVEGGGYIASVSCSILRNTHQGEQAASKKLAEQSAAEAAIQAEHHAEYAQVMGFAPVPVNGKKRKAPEPMMQQAVAPAGEINYKEQVNQACQLLKGSTLVKGDVAYETAEEEGVGYVATVTLVAHDPSVGYQGLPAANKKAAEMLAAEACLVAIQEIVAPLEEEHQAKKKAKNQESLAALKQRNLDKKAEKLAAAGEA